jgi:hypothetical protein
MGRQDKTRQDKNKKGRNDNSAQESVKYGGNRKTCRENG